MLSARRSLLLWPLIDLRDRILRFHGSIDELKASAQDGEREFLNSARKETVGLLTRYEDELQETLGRARVEKIDETSITLIARQSFTAFSLLQSQLVRYFPIWKRPASDIGVFAANALDLSPTRTSHRQLYFLTYGRYSTWTTHAPRSYSAPGSERVATIPIPYSETLTALRWPLLAHELAHWIYPGGEQLAPIARDAIRNAKLDDEELPESETIFAELFADRVGFRHSGMAYAYALATETALSRATDSGGDLAIEPTIGRRLAALGGEAAELGMLLSSEWGLDRAEDPKWPAGYFDRVRDAAEALDKRAAQEQLDRMEREAAFMKIAAPAAYATSDEAIAEARTLLADGQLASSIYQRPSHELRELRAVLSLTADATLAAADRAASEDLIRLYRLSAVHRPCTDADILTAAWQNELLREPQEMLDDLRARVVDGKASDDQRDDAIRTAVGRLAKRDTALSHSLQTANVHRWLLRYDDKIQQHTTMPNVATTGDEGEAPWDEDAPLSDPQIVRRLAVRSAKDPRQLVVRPLIDPDQIGSVTVDLRLGTEWEVLHTSRFQSLNPGDDQQRVEDLLEASSDEYRLTVGEQQDIVLHPGELLLALTLEYLRLPGDLWGNLEGRSTWARLGLQVHATAGMVDPGFEGYLTLELQNTGRLPLVLFPGLRVGQMAFFPVRNVKSPYNRKPTAAYSAQNSARSAFTKQHEHRAMRRFRDLEEHVRLERPNKP